MKTILFDLDGTLLPMDQDKFVRGYMKRLTTRFAPMGYSPEKLVNCIWAGMTAMVQNSGEQTNEAVFWACFAEAFGSERLADKELFSDFYRGDFNLSAADCGFNPAAKQTVDKLKSMGYEVVLATNPVFPAVATENRIRWAGCEPSDFKLITTYENSCHCKPNTAYFQDVITALGRDTSECLMVGNDTGEDLPCAELGAQVFLLTDCLINTRNVDVNRWPHGSFDDLLTFIQGL